MGVLYVGLLYSFIHFLHEISTSTQNFQDQFENSVLCQILSSRLSSEIKIAVRLWAENWKCVIN